MGFVVLVNRAAALPLLVPVIDETDVSLSDALSRLDSEARLLLVLKYYDRLKNREIADVLEWPLGSVGPRCSAALADLRRMLHEH